MNASTNGTQPEQHIDPKGLGEVVDICLYVFLTLALFGNTLLMTAITRGKQLRSQINYFVMNLAVCDILNVILIPFMLEVQASTMAHTNYPFGLTGCKILVPFNTYIKTTGILTLVCVAIEGFITISSISGVHSKTRIIISFVTIHSLGIIMAIPTCYYQTYVIWEGIWYCYEALSPQGAYIYTVCLFLFQYLLPLVIIAVMYSIAWYKLHKRNKKMIEMSEEYERKMAWGENSKTPTGSAVDSENDHDDTTTLTTETPLMKNHRSNSIQIVTSKLSTLKKSASSAINMKRILARKSTSFISETAFIRHRQTKRTLRMFIIVVIVFAIFQLPNQVLWLTSESSKYQLDICLILTYVSPVLNFWIYGGLNKRFRNAYIEVLSTIFLWKYLKHKIGRASVVTSTTRLSGNSSNYDNQQNQIFQERQSAFTDMFEYHDKHFDELKHLYNIKDDPQKVETQKPKRKITLANFINAFKGPSQSSLSLNNDGKPKKKMSLFSRHISTEQPKPRRKITVANIIGASKGPQMKTKQLSLPSLLTENHTHDSEDTSKNQDGADIKNLFVKSAVVALMAPTIQTRADMEGNIRDSVISSTEDMESVQKNHPKETYSKIKQKYKQNRTELTRSKRGLKSRSTHEEKPEIGSVEQIKLTNNSSPQPVPKQRSNSLTINKDPFRLESDRRAASSSMIYHFHNNSPNLSINRKNSISQDTAKSEKPTGEYRIKAAESESVRISDKEEPSPRRSLRKKIRKRKNATFSPVPQIFHIIPSDSKDAVHVKTGDEEENNIDTPRIDDKDENMITAKKKTIRFQMDPKVNSTSPESNSTANSSPVSKQNYMNTEKNNTPLVNESREHVNDIRSAPSSPISSRAASNELYASNHETRTSTPASSNQTCQMDSQINKSNIHDIRIFSDKNDLIDIFGENSGSRHLANSKATCFPRENVVKQEFTADSFIENKGITDVDKKNEKILKESENNKQSKICKLSSLAKSSCISRIANDNKIVTTAVNNQPNVPFVRKTKLTEHVNNRLAAARESGYV